MSTAIIGNTNVVQDLVNKLFRDLNGLLGKDLRTGKQKSINDPIGEDETEYFPVKDLLDALCDRPQYAEIVKLVEIRLREMFLQSLEMTDQECIEAEKAEQRTLPWFRARFKRLSASNFGTSAGHNPFDKNASSLLATMLWNIKFKTNASCQYGIDLEPVARDAYIAFMQKWRDDPKFQVVERNFFVNRKEPFLGFSPDGFVFANKEPMPSPEDIKRSQTFNPFTDTIQLEADKHRQDRALPFKKPRGIMSTCFDDNDHPDKIWMMEPVLEVFFDNETLEIVPFHDIPDDLFGKVKKTYGKKFDTSKAPKSNWPSPPARNKKNNVGSGFF